MKILVNTEALLQEALEAIKQSSIVVFDTETNGLRLYTDHRVIGIAFYCDFNGNSYYIPFYHGHGVFEPSTKTQVNANKADLTNRRYNELDLAFNQLHQQDVLEALKPILTPDRTYLCHNAQFDLTALFRAGIDLSGAVVHDTMLAARTLYSDFNRSYFRMPDTNERERGNNTLKWQARLFGLVKTESGLVGNEYELKEAMQYLKTALGKNTLNLDIKKHLWALSPEDVYKYACMDVELTYRLHDTLTLHLADWEQLGVYKLMCEHQTNVAWRMNKTGFLIDHARGNELLAEYEKERASLLEGITFNINSAPQIAAFALELGVKLPLTPKGNPKTDKKTLKSYQERIVTFKDILAVRALDKNVGTYIKKWLAGTTPEEPLHPFFNVLGAVTGRWSSSDKIAGNLQNIPKDTKLKYSPKKLLLPIDPKKQIVEIDYSQLEMRVGAWVAETIVGQGQDMTLTNLILDGVDMHVYTRDNAGVTGILLNGRSIEEYMATEQGHDLAQYEDEETLLCAFLDHARDVSKVPNFAAMYGGGWEALTNILDGITEQQARDIMEGWKEAYPTVVRAMSVLSNEAMEWRPKPGEYNEGGVTQYTIRPSVYQYIQYPDLCVPFIRKWSYYSESEKSEKSKDAFNSIVQGTAGFITVESINRVLKEVLTFNMDVHAQIHDSLVYSDFPDNQSNIPRIVEIMTDWDIVPGLECDVEIAPVGKAWGYKESE